MRGIGKRLREARVSAGLTQAQLAERAKLTQSAIAEIEAGRSRNSAKIIELSRALNVRADWLQTGESPSAPANSLDNGNVVEIGGVEFARLPVYDIRFAAGAGAVNEDESPIDHYLMSVSHLRAMTTSPIADVAVFQVDGDSMEPTINNRDWIFVDRRRTRLTNPGIYCLLFDGDALVKRAAQHLESGVVTLISDNEKYPPQRIKSPDRLQVIGRVFLSIRRH